MRTGRNLRAVAVGAATAVLGMLTLSGVASANETPPVVPPPTTPPPAHTVQACVDSYQQNRNSILATFRLAVTLDLSETSFSKSEKIAAVIDDFATASEALSLL